MKKYIIFLFMVALIYANRQNVIFDIQYPSGKVIERSIEEKQNNEFKPSFYRQMEETENDTVVISYDSGNLGSYTTLSSGDIEAMRFFTEHPCSIFAVEVYSSSGGTSMPFNMKIWSDWSGFPAVSEELASFVLTPGTVLSWYSVNLEDVIGSKIYMPAWSEFHVGRIVNPGPPYFVLGTNTVDPISHLYISSEDTWYNIVDSEDNYVPYKIRVHAFYFDSETDHSFENVAEESGLTEGGRTIAFADIDNDGDDDVICTGILYYSNGDGTFTYSDFDFGGNTSFGDFTGDGFLDAVTVNTNLILWENDGDGTFTDITTEFGIVDYPEDKKVAGSFGDLDGDGWLDLYVLYTEDWNDGSPIYYPDHVYRNVNGTSFDELTEDMPSIVAAPKYSRGANFCDFDGDGDMDVYISRYRLEPNLLLVNNGDGTFTDESAAYGVMGHYVDGAYGHTIGSSWCDFDNDGDFDLISANLAHPRFIDFSDKTYIYRNNGDGTFTDIFEDSGISYYETHSNPSVGDFNNDGNLDLYITGVYVGYRSFIYYGNGDGTFTPADYETGILTDNGWGSAWSDVDNDGDLDLLASGNSGLELWKNISAAPRTNHWIKVYAYCDDTDNNYLAYGAQAYLYMNDGRVLSRCIQGNSGTESCMDSRVMHFGVGEADRADSLIVIFPGLTRITKTDINVRNRSYTIYESGEGIENDRFEVLPAEISISTYPNPFNSVINIEVREDAILEIYDIQGNLIENLGYERTFRANNIPSGVYLINAQIDDIVISKKIMYMK